MKRNRIDEYHKHGCHFYGKLVVIKYLDEMKHNPRYGQYNAGLSIDYLMLARKEAQELYGDNIVDELLSVPELVLRLK